MAKRKRQDKQTVNQRREDNVMAKRKRQDKQTINQRRENNVMAKRIRQVKQTVCLSCLFLLAITLFSLL
jgi:hypothetical protein